MYAVGKIIGCFGVQGYVKIHPTTHTAERLTSLRNVAVGVVEEQVQQLIIEDVILRNRIVLMRFLSVDDRNTAETLVGKFVFVHEDEVRKPQKGSYFTHDVIGCEVYATDGRHLGNVEDVYKLPAQDVWTVRKGSKQYMIPAVKEFIREVDVQQRKIIIEVIEGLIDE